MNPNRPVDGPALGELTELVVTVLAEVLAGAVDTSAGGVGLTASTPLFDLPGFDSLVLAEFVERLEASLGWPLPDEAMVPETFETPAHVAARLVAPAMNGAGA